MIITILRDKHKGKNRKNKLRYFIPFLVYQMNLFFTVLWKIFQKRKSFSIIHCIEAGSWLSLYSVLIGKMFNKKTILEMTMLNSDDPLSIKNNSNRSLGFLRYWLFSKADLVVSISPALTEAYKLSHLPIERLREVPNSVDIKKFMPVNKVEKINLRRRLGYNENQIIILCVGAIIKRKGIDLLVKSFSKFKDKYNNAILVLVGPIPIAGNKENTKFYQEYLEIKKLIFDLHLEHFTHLTGIKNNIDEYMKISDLFVFLSRKEGLPNVVLEAMATGLPVITYKIPGISEYVINDRLDGILISEENPDRIAYEMEAILKDREYYQKISINSRNTVLNRFTDQIVDNQYEKIYKEFYKINP